MRAAILVCFSMVGDIFECHLSGVLNLSTYQHPRTHVHVAKPIP